MAISPKLYRMAGAWCVYLLRCGDGTLYAGVTNDLDKRLAAHRGNRGARYTKGRGPLTVVHREEMPDKSAALRRERALKRLPRKQKLLILDSGRKRRE